MNKLLERVNAVAVATGNKDKKSQLVTENEEVDEFTLAKRRMNLDIRELRQMISDRDKYANSITGKNDQPEIIRQSNEIRKRIRDLRDVAASMRQMIEKDRDKARKKGVDLSGVEAREKMCDLIDAHLDECEQWSKGHSFSSAKDSSKRRALLKGANLQDDGPVEMANFVPGDPTESALENIDDIDEWRLQVQENEQVIEEQLTQILEQTQAVSVLSKKIGDEYEALGIMVNDVEEQMEKAENNLGETNAQMEHAKKKLASASNCCCDIFLFLIMLALVGFLIWKYV